MLRFASWLGSIALTLLATAAAASAAPLQTQTSMTGDVEVDVTRARVKEGILTVVLTYRNTGSETAKIKYGIDQVYYLDNVGKKKYHVLKDSEGKYIAAPAARGSISVESGFGNPPVEIAPGGSRGVWFKFPAPSDEATTVELVVPDLMPFEDLPIAR